MEKVKTGKVSDYLISEERIALNSIYLILFQMLQEQKAACDAMIEEKDKLINELQQVNIVIAMSVCCNIVGVKEEATNETKEQIL